LAAAIRHQIIKRHSGRDLKPHSAVILIDKGDIERSALSESSIIMTADKQEITSLSDGFNSACDDSGIAFIAEEAVEIIFGPPLDKTPHCSAYSHSIKRFQRSVMTDIKHNFESV
jgi:hypothetical protein